MRFPWHQQPRTTALCVRAVAVLAVVVCLLAAQLCSGACTATSCFTATEQTNTRAFLNAFATAVQWSGWTGTDFCAYSYVTCSDDGAAVSLSWRSLSGSLPDLSTLGIDGSQVKVYSIDISYNTVFKGTVPTSWSVLTRLKKLDLSSNSISGTLPPTWSGMTGLQYLAVSQSKVTGTLPSTWSALTNLQFFFAAGTSLTGTIPSEWSAMKSLTTFMIQQSTIAGSLPASWSALPQLRYVVVVGTAVSGALPTSWSALTTLTSLRIEGTKVAGTLPAEWSSLTSLREFKANGTSLEGTIPTSWGGMASLQAVALSGTAITGCLPKEWLCSRGLTTAGVGLTSTSSAACASKEAVCNPTTTAAPTTPTVGSKLKWWTIGLIVLLVVDVLVILQSFLWCWCASHTTQRRLQGRSATRAPVTEKDWSDERVSRAPEFGSMRGGNEPGHALSRHGSVVTQPALHMQRMTDRLAAPEVQNRSFSRSRRSVTAYDFAECDAVIPFDVE